MDKSIFSFCLIFFCILTFTLADVNNEKIRKSVTNRARAKRTLTGNKNWDAVVGAFRETIIRGFLQGDALKITSLAVGHPIGIASIWLLTIIKASRGQPDSEWQKMEEKLNRKISASIDDNNIENLDDELNRITYLMGKAQRNQFTKEDLNEIRSYAPNFFPQQYTAGKFTVKWANVLTKYLAIISACYIDLMKQGVYDKCEWADRLRKLKPQILTAAKKLAKSRYQDLEKTDWHGGTTVFKPTAKLSFKDKATGKKFEGIPLKNIEGSVFTPLKQDTETFLMENLVNQFNLLFNDSWTPIECNPPSPITSGDLDVKYPRKCMDSSGTCTFPCGYYTQGYKWCVKWPGHHVKENKWKTGGSCGRVSCTKEVEYWQKCNYPNWDKCMLTPRVPLIDWTDEDYGKKK